MSVRPESLPSNGTERSESAVLSHPANTNLRDSALDHLRASSTPGSFAARPDTSATSLDFGGHGDIYASAIPQRSAPSPEGKATSGQNGSPRGSEQTKAQTTSEAQPNDGLTSYGADVTHGAGTAAETAAKVAKGAAEAATKSAAMAVGGAVAGGEGAAKGATAGGEGAAKGATAGGEGVAKGATAGGEGTAKGATAGGEDAAKGATAGGEGAATGAAAGGVEGAATGAAAGGVEGATKGGRLAAAAITGGEVVGKALPYVATGVELVEAGKQAHEGHYAEAGKTAATAVAGLAAAEGAAAACAPGGPVASGACAAGAYAAVKYGPEAVRATSKLTPEEANAMVESLH